MCQWLSRTNQVLKGFWHLVRSNFGLLYPKVPLRPRRQRPVQNKCSFLFHISLAQFTVLSSLLLCYYNVGQRGRARRVGGRAWEMRGFPCMGLLRGRAEHPAQGPRGTQRCWRSCCCTRASTFWCTTALRHWLYEHKHFFLARWVSQRGRHKHRHRDPPRRQDRQGSV